VSGRAITPQEAALLLRSSQGYKALPRAGAIQYYDKESRCVSRGCSSPTHYKIDGVAYCVPHLLERANETIDMLRACTDPANVKRIIELLEGGEHDSSN
jgi:hypothetical protein